MACNTEYTINYDASTIEDAKEYLAYRYKQLLKFGWTVKEEIVVDDNSIVTLYNDPRKEGIWGSVYVLKQHRGKQVFLKRIQQFMIGIVTLSECNLGEYLKSRKINHITLEHSAAYRLIQHEYKGNGAARSSVPFIYHIDEGGAILEKLGASNIVKDAYYLHPLLQSDTDFVNNKSMDFEGVSTESIILACEYRRVANSYLSYMEPEDFVGFTCDEIKQMLIADKIQNYKDFREYHYGTHPRSEELQSYFMNWFNILGIEYNDWSSFNYY
jgi:hypothetical protein